MYNLVAVLGGTQLSTTPLQVVGAGQPLIPIIQMEDAPPNSPPDPAPLIEGSPFVLIFEGFQPGMVNVFVNSPAGQLIGTTTSTARVRSRHLSSGLPSRERTTCMHKPPTLSAASNLPVSVVPLRHKNGSCTVALPDKPEGARSTGGNGNLLLLGQQLAGQSVAPQLDGRPHIKIEREVSLWSIEANTTWRTSKHKSRAQDTIGYNGRHSGFEEIISIIHKPGWTTPAEYVLVSGTVDRMHEQAKALASLRQTLLNGGRAVELNLRPLLPDKASKKTTQHQVVIFTPYLRQAYHRDILTSLLLKGQEQSVRIRF